MLPAHFVIFERNNHIALFNGYTGRGRGGALVVIIWWLFLQLPMQSVPITIKVVSSNPAHGEVYSIPQFEIKFVGDLRHVSGFLQVLRFPPPIKLTSTI
jgi:hypothetical protein